MNKQIKLSFIQNQQDLIYPLYFGARETPQLSHSDSLISRGVEMKLSREILAVVSNMES